MAKMDTEDGHVFIKHLAQFVRTHEKALANALQLRRQTNRHAHSSGTSDQAASSTSSSRGQGHISSSSAFPSSTSISSALSLPLSFTSANIKSTKLSLTPHHLFYLLSRFEEMGIIVGPMNVRLENIHSEASPANYVSFLGQSQRPKGRASDRDSIHSVSSVRSVMSGMSSLWSSFGLGSSTSEAKSEKAKAALQADLRYLYSAFTKIPCLKLAPDYRARLIKGYEEFPFDTAVPLLAFKNISVLEISDIDIRQLFGWDRLAEQLRSLTVKRAGVENTADLIINIVLDDMDKRRRRYSKNQPSPVIPWAPSPVLQHGELARSNSAPGSPNTETASGHSSSPQSVPMTRAGSEGSKALSNAHQRSDSPMRPPTRQGSSHGYVRGPNKTKRSESNSSSSSLHSSAARNSASSSNLLSMGILPPTKWRFLRHLSMADNSLTSISAVSLMPLADTLHSLDLSSNLFSEIPDSLAILTSLRALNLSNCMIDSLHSLLRSPLPAVTALNLRANRLSSLAGVERLLSLERLDLRDNKLTDPMELARLTSIPEIREIWVGHNPFTKTHSNYRVTIFNLFRTSPGYTEDILIDSSGPGYTERRHLVDRVPEPAGVPVVKSLPAASPYAYPGETARSDNYLRQERDKNTAEETSRSEPREYQNEVVVGSNRRRKATRRRVVELSSSSSPPKVSPMSASNIQTHVDQPNHASAVSNNGGKPTIRPVSPQNDLPKLVTKMPTADKPVVPESISKAQNKEAQDWAISGELYRKKIEALRNEVGNGWLSVLSEEGWDGQRDQELRRQAIPEYSPASTVRPSPTTPRMNSQGVISGARTLG